MICWVLLLQEFDIEIRDKKGMENVAADHLSRLENPHLEELEENKIGNDFPDEYLLVVAGEIPWFANIANYLATKYIPKDLTRQQKKKFFSEIKYYFWDEPYLFRSCAYGMIRRCVFGKESREILEHCHNGPTRGHHGAHYTAFF